MVAALPAVTWDGTPASTALALAGVGASCLALLLGARPPWPFMAWLLVAMTLALTSSFAAGSSWAFLTWIPLITASLLLGRLSVWFLAGALGAVVARDLATLVVLTQVFGTLGTSGSLQYLVGFAAATLAPLLLAVTDRRIAANRSAALRFTLLALASAGLGTVLWAVLASGARAALLGATLGLLTALVLQIVSHRGRAHAGATLLILVIGAASVVPLDSGMTRVFGTGEDLAVATFTGSIGDTISELDGVFRQDPRDLRRDDANRAPTPTPGDRFADRPGSMATRLALWRQAILMMLTRPWGHGSASYAHVNHAYQTEPLLWSGSPHSVWALAAVETGTVGVLALLLLVVGGLVRAASRASAASGALIAATVVMSLDVFASMPAESLLWWAAIGAAWGPVGHHARGPSDWPRRAAWGIVLLSLLVGGGMSFRLSQPCKESCDPIVHFGGNPRLTGAPTAVVNGGPDDPDWALWRSYYPFAYWLAHATASSVTSVSDDGPGSVKLLRDYPYQSIVRYVTVAQRSEDAEMATSVAACGLSRFYAGGPIWRDWRSSGAEIERLRGVLETLAAGASVGKDHCLLAGLPRRPIGLR